MSGTPTASPEMPEWAQSLSEKYSSRTVSLFVLYGNVRDLVPLHRLGSVEYVPLASFLNEALFGRRDLAEVDAGLGDHIDGGRPGRDRT